MSRIHRIVVKVFMIIPNLFRTVRIQDRLCPQGSQEMTHIAYHRSIVICYPTDLSLKSRN